MSDGQRNGAEISIQLPQTKVTSAAESDSLSGPLVSRIPGVHRSAAVHAVFRLLCLLTSVTSLWVMTTAEQASTMSLYGFSIPLSSKWSFADSFEYLVGICAAVAAHSLLQLIVNLSRILKKSPVINSRNHGWLLFASDQIFAYAMISAGSAASGVTNLNRTGIRHSALPNFCKPLQAFCGRVAVSIAFAFFSCFFLAASVVLDVILLTK